MNKCMCQPNTDSCVLHQRQAVRLCYTSLVPITVVRHKLRIIEENTSSYLWYKDEGTQTKPNQTIIHTATVPTVLCSS